VWKNSLPQAQHVPNYGGILSIVPLKSSPKVLPCPLKEIDSSLLSAIAQLFSLDPAGVVTLNPWNVDGLTFQALL
jgi:hypothetical protein